MKPVYRSNMFALILILTQVLGSIVIGGFLREFFNIQQLLVVTQILFLLVPTIVYFVITKLPVRETLRLNPISFGDIGLIIVIAVFSQPVAVFLSTFSNMFFRNLVNDVFNQINSISYVRQLGIIALTPAIFEEITMRGVILSGYRKVSNIKAALITGLFFGILHMNPQQFLYAFVLGILFAYIVIITDSLIAAMVCHFFFNGIQISYANFIMWAMPEAVTEAPGLESMPIYDKINLLVTLAFIALIFSALIFLLVKKLYKRNLHKRHLAHLVDRNKLSVDDRRYESKREDEMIDILYEESHSVAKERVINVPFITTVVIYLILMIVSEIYGKL